LKRLNTISSSELLKNSRLIPTEERCASVLGRTRLRVVPWISHRRTRRREQKDGGGERDRTDDPLLAKQVLSQLSYTPVQGGGGSGWIRTSDPRLIKTVL